MTRTIRSIPAIGKCFDHLGGKLAPVLFNCIVELEWIRPKQGRKSIFEVTQVEIQGGICN